MCRLLSISFVVILLMSANALATIITPSVENFSFEQPGTVKIKGWDAESGQADIPGWHSDIAAIDSGVESDWPGCTEGDWSGFLMNSPDPSVWNIVSYRIVAGDQFILAVDARDNWTADESKPALLQMTLFYVAVGGARTVIATQTVPLDGSQGTPVQDKDPWRTYKLDTGELIAEPPVGRLLGIELQNVTPGTKSSWIGIDNVRFVPEPATIALLGLGGLSLLRIRKRH